MAGTDLAWSQATTIDEVLERLAAIDAAHPVTDGVATFNRMYRQVTLLVKEAVGEHRFRAGAFLDRLDVNFGNLYFRSYEASVTGAAIPPAWLPLFEARDKPDTHPIQFALAGMNAHISHDLAFAVVTTCHELGVRPSLSSPEHADFTETNEVLQAATAEIKSWFSTGIVATLDELGGRLDDGFAMFGIHTSRAAAWDTSEMLWHLEDNPRMNALFVRGLERAVELTSRGILL